MYGCNFRGDESVPFLIIGHASGALAYRLSECQPLSTRIQERIRIHSYAPTDSMLGKKPSFKLLSNFLISSIELAFAMASFTLSASSFDIRRPAFPGTATGRGSSVETTCFEVCVAEVDIEVASAFIRPSAVRKSFLEASRSYHFHREPENHPLSAL